MHFKDEKTFEHFFLFCFFLGLVIIPVSFRCLEKYGVDTKSRKVQLFATLPSLTVGILPFWINSDISLWYKFVIPLLGISAGIVYFIGLIKVQDTLKK